MHECGNGKPCSAWICRFKDGAKICAISGRFLASEEDISPRKRAGESTDFIPDEQGDVAVGKRHQEKPIPNSSADLSERFNVNADSCDMDVVALSPSRFDVAHSLHSYNPKSTTWSGAHWMDERSWTLGGGPHFI